MDSNYSNIIRIRNYAKEVLFQSSQSAPPVNLQKILKLYDLELEKVEFPREVIDALRIDSISGLVCLDDSKIFINNRDSTYRQRFTIAHELGHIILKHPATTKSKSHSQSKFEKDADLFAAELLMPFEWLKRDLDSGQIKYCEIKLKYLVSDKAFENRIQFTSGLIENVTTYNGNKRLSIEEEAFGSNEIF